MLFAAESSLAARLGVGAPAAEAKKNFVQRAEAEREAGAALSLPELI